MTPILLTGPAIEPISVEETKIFLRVEHDDDDQLIAALIAGARSHIEAQTQTALITQNWRMVLDAWPQHGRITVTRSKPKSGRLNVYSFPNRTIRECLPQLQRRFVLPCTM